MMFADFRQCTVCNGMYEVGQDHAHEFQYTSQGYDLAKQYLIKEGVEVDFMRNDGFSIVGLANRHAEVIE